MHPSQASKKFWTLRTTSDARKDNDKEPGTAEARPTRYFSPTGTVLYRVPVGRLQANLSPAFCHLASLQVHKYKYKHKYKDDDSPLCQGNN